MRGIANLPSALTSRQKRSLVVKTTLVTLLCLVLILTLLPGSPGNMLTDTLYSSGIVHSDPIVCDECFQFYPRYPLDNYDLCAGDDVFLLVLVASRPSNVTHRNAIRETWGRPRLIFGSTVKIIFLTGRTNDSDTDTQEVLRTEHRKHRDIVQADFVDSYRNLTYKSVMGLQWAMRSCSKAKFLLKTDDDTFVNLERIIVYLRTLNPLDEFIGGNCFTSRPIRDLKSKWYVGPEEYTATYYPMYCNGFAYVMSMVTAARLVQVQPNIPFMYIEDVYITGMCRNALKIPYRNMISFVPDSYYLRPCDYVYYVLTAHYVNDTMLYHLNNMVNDQSFIRYCLNRRRIQIQPFLLCAVLALLAFVIYLVLRRSGLVILIKGGTNNGSNEGVRYYKTHQLG